MNQDARLEAEDRLQDEAGPEVEVVAVGPNAQALRVVAVGGEAEHGSSYSDRFWP